MNYLFEWPLLTGVIWLLCCRFAAEVFHGLQEQVMSTASRTRKLTVHVQRIEAALPPLEKAVLSQTSHIHFAYTAGMASVHVFCLESL